MAQSFAEQKVKKKMSLISELADLVTIRNTLRVFIADRGLVSNAQRSTVETAAREAEKTILALATSVRFVSALHELENGSSEEPSSDEDEVDDGALSSIESAMKIVAATKSGPSKPIDEDESYQKRLAEMKAKTPEGKRIKVKKVND